MEKLATTKNGIDVYLDRDNSHASTHMKDRPELHDYAVNIISSLELTQPIRQEFNMGFVVGKSDLVKTTENSDIFYAKRKNRTTYIPFVRGVERDDTQIITIDIREKDGIYYLYTIYVGENTPSLPGSDGEEPNSKEFWNSHALVYSKQELQEETVTKSKP